MLLLTGQRSIAKLSIAALCVIAAVMGPTRFLVHRSVLPLTNSTAVIGFLADSVLLHLLLNDSARRTNLSNLLFALGGGLWH